MTDEPQKVIDLEIDGSVVKINVTLNEGKALLVTLQDWIGEVESQNEELIEDPVLEAEIIT